MRGKRADRIADLEKLYPAWVPMTMWERFEACVSKHPNRQFAVFDNGASYTYAQFERRADGIADALWGIGVRPGVHVALKMANSPELLLLSFALAKIQAVKVAVNSGVGPYELSYILDKSDSTYLFSDTDVEFPETAEPKKLHRCIVLHGSAGPQGFISTTWGNMLANPSDARVKEGAADPHAISDIIFTSGSTGTPKGVPLTSDKLQLAAFANCLNRGFEDGRRVFVPLPFFHCYGYVEGILAVLFVAGTLLFSTGKFDAAKCLRFIKEQRANDILNVPVQALHFAQELQRSPMDLPDLHAMYCAGSSCPSWVIPEIMSLMGITDVNNGYGMTEMSGAAMQTIPGDSPAITDRCVGRILPAGCTGRPEFGGAQSRYRVVRPGTTRDMPPGEPGELICRGITMMEGYYHDPEANEENFTADGWLKTGDIGRFDEQGYLELYGRMRDTYRINGENVSPSFIEKIIERDANVQDAVVLGIPDERYGSVGALFVELREDGSEQRNALKRFCKSNLAHFQVPKYFYFLGPGDWPRTETGKVQNFKLRQLRDEGAFAEG